MGVCELCGAEGPVVDAIVEGSMLVVCNKCVQFGEAIPVAKPVVENPRRANIVVEKKKELDMPEDSLVEDFAMRIRVARERKGMKQEDLAKALAEKESVVHRVESGQLEPDEILIKKLEQFLGVSLKEKVKVKRSVESLNVKDSNITIGDLLKMGKE